MHYINFVIYVGWSCEHMAQFDWPISIPWQFYNLTNYEAYANILLAS
jgi:hypothetical protein